MEEYQIFMVLIGYVSKEISSLPGIQKYFIPFKTKPRKWTEEIL